MQFPEKPTCHEPTILGFNYGEDAWRPAEDGTPATRSHPDNDGPFRPFRTCNYCGSMHPEDLIAALEAGAKLGGSDWKYGWPHKFYIEQIPHAHENVMVVTSSTYRDGQRQPLEYRAMGKGWGKWYNIHLTDLGFDDEARAKLIALLEEKSGIRFNIDPEKGLGYAAPYRGYQR